MLIPSPRPERLNPPIQLEKLLLAEGETPANLFEELAKHLGLSDQIEIRSFGGISQFGKYVKTIASTADFKAKVKSLGIIRDAEHDPVGARQSITHGVQNANLPSGVTVKIAILPDDSTPGKIESLCLRSVQGHEVFECIEALVKCLENKNLGLPADHLSHKHLLDFFLASIGKPQTFPGIAARQGVWPFDHAAFDEIRKFLQGL